MMQFICEKLLESQINITPRNEQDEFFILMCKRELAVIQKLKVEKIDLTGSMEEVTKRLEENHIYFMNSKEYCELYRKAEKFDEIKDIIG